MKLDMQKTYDSLKWTFLEQIVVNLVFPDKYVRWIMKCVTTVSYSIMINGSPTESFKGRKDLRQGDPLSPFLFILAMECLSRRLKRLMEFNKIIVIFNETK